MGFGDLDGPLDHRSNLDCFNKSLSNSIVLDILIFIRLVSTQNFRVFEFVSWNLFEFLVLAVSSCLLVQVASKLPGDIAFFICTRRSVICRFQDGQYDSWCSESQWSTVRSVAHHRPEIANLV